jgi:adenosine deaminase
MKVPPARLGPGDEARAAWLRAMPKAELHLHLDGSVLPATALELAMTRGIDAPESLSAMRAALVAPARGASQAELLRAFDLPIALMQDAEALERVTRELVEVKARDRVRYVEIRWGPLLHTRRGLGLEDGIAAVCLGAETGARETGTVVRLICTALRSHDPAANVVLAETAGRFRDRALVGFDLAGPEEAFPDPLLHRAAFETARRVGLRITLHAGEWDGPAQVWRALEVGPERIAHGSVAVDDGDLCDELIRRDVALDLCPTSAIARRRRPRGRASTGHSSSRGVPVSLSTCDRRSRTRSKRVRSRWRSGCGRTSSGRSSHAPRRLGTSAARSVAGEFDAWAGIGKWGPKHSLAGAGAPRDSAQPRRWRRRNGCRRAAAQALRA